MNALCLKVIGSLTADDEALTDENIPEVNENNHKEDAHSGISIARYVTWSLL